MKYLVFRRYSKIRRQGRNVAPLKKLNRRNSLGAILFCALLALATINDTAKAQTVTLSIGQSYGVGERALIAQEFQLAFALGAGLLERDPNDFRALLLVTGAHIGLGNNQLALEAGRRAFRQAASNQQKVQAARLIASAHFREGNFTRAQWWLRRGMNNAVEGENAQALRQDFARVRQVNPLTVNLNFSAAPNNNVNNGSSSDTVTIFNLPFVLSPDARSLSGYEVSASADLRYRVSQSTDYATDIGLLLYARAYELTAAAKAAAPGVRGSDYGFSVVELSLNHNRNLPGFSGSTSFGLNIGQNWYGGAPYTRYARANVGQIFRPTENTNVTLTLGYEHQISLLDSGTATDIYSLGTSISQRLASNDQISGSLRLQRAISGNPSNTSTALRAGLQYGFAKPILGTRLSLNMSAEKRDFGFSVYDIAGRNDMTLSLGASIVFINLSYFGFSPSMSVEANQTVSNIDLFDRQSLALRFGLQSTF